jgi:pilus assembly protein CpaB
MAKIKLVPILVAVVAIGIAFAISLIVYSKFQSKPTIGKPAAVDTIPIAVANIDVPWGTSIDKSMIKMVPYLKDSLPSGCFSDRLALEGRILVYPVKTDEPIFESRLAPISVTIGGVAAVLTPKKRAMSVKVNAVIGISGFILPNNRVDVLVTINRTEEEGGPITKVVLENILVLAVGPTLGDADKKDKSQQRGVSEITLEVTPEEGEQLALATNKGAIQLALRNFADTEDVITTGSTPETLLASYSKSYDSSKSDDSEATDKPWKIQMYNVIVIKGTEVSKVAF